MLFLSTQLLGKYNMMKVETWLVALILYEDNTVYFFIDL